MDKIIDTCIITCENCVTQCLCLKDHQMNDCVSICLTNERIIKALKVCLKCNCDRKISNHLLRASLESVNKCISVCSKHQDKHDHCKKCVVENTKLQKALVKKLKKKITNKVAV